MNQLAEQLTSALSDATSGDSESVRQTVKEIRTEKEDELQQLRKEKRELKEENEELRTRVGDLQDQVETLEKRKLPKEKLEEARSAYAQLGDVLGLSTSVVKSPDTDSDREEKLGDYERFLQEEAVRSEIEEAKEESSSPRYVRGVIKTIMHSGGPVTYDEIADLLDISTTSHVGQAVKTLNEYNVVTKARRGRKTVVDLNINDLDSIRNAARRKEVVGDL